MAMATPSYLEVTIVTIDVFFALKSIVDGLMGLDIFAVYAAHN
jgi:hypothetical protein